MKMNNNPFDNDNTPKTPADKEFNPYANEQNIFLTEPEDDENAVYSSENVDFDSPVAEEQKEECSPVSQTEYVYPDTRNIYSDSSTSKTSENINNDTMRSYEWYGKSPVAETIEFPKSKKERNRKGDKRTPVAVILLVCILVSTFFGAGSAVITNYFLSSDNSSQTVVVDNKKEEQQNNNSNTITVAPQTDELLTTEIVEKYADSVVEIVTETIQTGIFSQQYIESGAGSGVIIDQKGHIVTNHHVIEGAQRISVTLRNGKTYEARLLGSDEKMDLALLKIEAEKLTTAVIGDSDTLRVGQRTIAIGNPLGQLGGTVTEGIISALDRAVTVDGKTMNLLQTDTAINPGNSGGGLFDQYGNLIGVVVAKSSGSEVEGLGFAIPINDAVLVLSDLMEYGYVRGRVDMGMEFIDVNTESMAWMYGLSNLGCYVYRVDSGSNAAQAGFKSGDLILKVDGKEVDTTEDIEAVIDGKKLGDKVKFTVMRGRSTGELELTLEEYVPSEFRTELSDIN